MILTYIFDDADLLRRISYRAILITGGSFNGLLYNGLPTLIWCFLTILIIQLLFGGGQRENDTGH